MIEPQWEPMKAQMSTRNPTGTRLSAGNCTDFVLHKSQHNSWSREKNVVDFSEKKLEKYIDSVADAQQKMILVAMLSDYVCGNIAIAWKKGTPVYIPVTKDR